MCFTREERVGGPVNRDQVISLVAGVIKAKARDLSDSDSLGRTDGWDSLAHLEIIEKLEEDSGRRLTSEEILFSESIEDLLSIFVV